MKKKPENFKNGLELIWQLICIIVVASHLNHFY
jgi:hypothetical protein